MVQKPPTCERGNAVALASLTEHNVQFESQHYHLNDSWCLPLLQGDKWVGTPRPSGVQGWS